MDFKVLRSIPNSIFDLYKPVSRWESFYLKTRWRLCPFELIESCIPLKGRILDFGCGYGMLSNFLEKRGRHRHELDEDGGGKPLRLQQEEYSFSPR